jgi:hypothetical protein
MLSVNAEVTRSHPYAPQLGHTADHHQCSDAEELATPKL